VTKKRLRKDLGRRGEGGGGTGGSIEDVLQWFSPEREPAGEAKCKEK